MCVTLYNNTGVRERITLILIPGRSEGLARTLLEPPSGLLLTALYHGRSHLSPQANLQLRARNLVCLRALFVTETVTLVYRC